MELSAAGAVSRRGRGAGRAVRVALLDVYLEFLEVRSRPNTVVAVAYDLQVFFTVVGKAPGLPTGLAPLVTVTEGRYIPHGGGRL